MPVPVRNLPRLVIDVAQNGYIVHVWQDGQMFGNGTTPSHCHVATSMAGLLQVIKEVAVEARLCGNQPPAG